LYAAEENFSAEEAADNLSFFLSEEPCGETIGHMKIEHSFSVSFLQAKRVWNLSEKLSE